MKRVDRQRRENKNEKRQNAKSEPARDWIGKAVRAVLTEGAMTKEANEHARKTRRTAKNKPETPANKRAAMIGAAADAAIRRPGAILANLPPHIRLALRAGAREVGVDPVEVTRELLAGALGDAVPNALYAAMTPAECARFVEAAKRTVMGPEELMRVMAFQAIRQIESEGCVRLTHLKRTDGTKETARRVACVVELYPREVARLQEVSERMNRPADYILSAGALAMLNNAVL